MALRWRKTGELICAAKSDALPDDCYIDDGLHYQLSVILGVAVPHVDEELTGLWQWISYKDFIGPVLPGYAAHIVNT